MKKSEKLKFPLRGKYVVMVAPSFIVDFPYPGIISGLKELGFDNVVELTFGAKLVNKEYHEKLKEPGFFISSVCPGVVDVVCKKFPQYKDNLIKVDSPMIAMAKVCKKIYPKHKIAFISPCNYKKIEASKYKLIDFVIDYKELKNIFLKHKIKLNPKNKIHFDKFYNDYTKIYPLAGGLSKTAHLKGILKKKQIKKIDGIVDVMKFLSKQNKKIRFLDCNFCVGACIGGPCINSIEKISKKRKNVLKYLKLSKREDIPRSKKGLIERAEGISFVKKSF